jgi:hypothetical protein
VEDMRRAITRIATEFRDKAPLTPPQAATIILDGVRSGAWRILVGRDADQLDAAIRALPNATYDYATLFRAIAGQAREPAG